MRVCRFEVSATTMMKQKFAAALCSLLAVSPLYAEERDPASAQALFDQGVELASAGKYTEACPKLAESQRLDPGIGTEFHLANCYEQLGRVASAWALFLEVASVARASNQTDREKVANARARKLEARLPKLTFVVPEAARAPNLEIKRDGIAVGAAQWGTPVPIDPGSHEITVSAPGRRSESRTVSAAEREAVTFEVPTLELAPVAESPPSASAPTREEPKDEGSSKPMGLILGLAGVGVLGVGVGTAFGLMARAENQDSMAYCRDDEPNKCQERGVTLRDGAMKKGTIATVAFAVGGAALVGAGVVWLVGGSSGGEKKSGLSVGARVSLHEPSLVVKGTF